MALYQILLRTELLSIGRWRCPPDDERWQRENWIGSEPHVVFPFRPVLIEQSGRRPVVATPNHVVLYDAAQTYRRALLSPDGDVATFVIVDDRLARDLVHEGDWDGTTRFPRAEMALDASTLLQFQLLVRALGLATVDQLAAEETAIAVLGAVLRQPADGIESHAAPRPRRRSTRQLHDDLVDETKRLLARRVAENVGLAELGRAVGASPFHLARIFRASTGQSIHGYREQIRLRHALESLTDVRPEPNLSRLATDLGFASHAHFDTRFRRTFGHAPGAVRALGRRAELRTIVEARRRLPA